MFPRCFGLLLTVAVAWLPVAPPEHVHHAEEHGQQHLLIHRHLAAHSHSDHAATHGATLDEDDAPVLTLDAVYVVPGSLPALEAVPGTVRFLDPVGRPSAGSREYVERLIHGPPRAPTSLRAPPSVSHL